MTALQLGSRLQLSDSSLSLSLSLSLSVSFPFQHTKPQQPSEKGRDPATTASASPARQILARLEGTEAPRDPPVLPDEILREILLRLSPADLARASMACASSRGFLAEPSFLRRYHSLHPPLLLGFLDGEFRFRPSEAPHPSGPAGHAFAHGADFEFDSYVPRKGRRRWCTCDARDGRVLLSYGPCINKSQWYWCVAGFPDLAVCDPLSRRYLLLPPIPDGLLASIQVRERNIKAFFASMVPSVDGEDDTTFRVMGMAQWMEKLAVFIFSSGTGGWTTAASTTWEALSLTVPQDGRVLQRLGRGSFAYGCYYRRVLDKKRLLRFDTRTAEFSTIDLPPPYNMLEICVVEAGEGRLGMFSKITMQTIRYSICQNRGQGSMQWGMVNLIPLPEKSPPIIVGAFGGCIFLVSYPRRGTRETACYSLDIKTLRMMKICKRMGFLHDIHPYLGYPPSMSPRRI